MRTSDRQAVSYRRRFWAMFLETSVKKDGQVPGFSAWWDDADPWQRERGQAIAEAVWREIDRKGRDPEECIAAGVAAFRLELRQYLPKSERRSEPEYAAFRFSVINRVLSEQLTPTRVADLLQEYRDTHGSGGVPDQSEIDIYRAAGDNWKAAAKALGMRPYANQPLKSVPAGTVRGLVVEEELF